MLAQVSLKAAALVVLLVHDGAPVFRQASTAVSWVAWRALHLQDGPTRGQAAGHDLATATQVYHLLPQPAIVGRVHRPLISG